MEITNEQIKMVEELEQELLEVKPEMIEELKKIEKEDSGIIEYMQAN